MGRKGTMGRKMKRKTKLLSEKAYNPWITPEI